jgi:hypothetical protein
MPPFLVPSIAKIFATWSSQMDSRVFYTIIVVAAFAHLVSYCHN